MAKGYVLLSFTEYNWELSYHVLSNSEKYIKLFCIFWKEKKKKEKSQKLSKFSKSGYCLSVPGDEEIKD